MVVARRERSVSIPPVTVPLRKARLLWIGGALLLCAIRLAGGGAGGSSPADDHARYHDQSFLVVNVLDGDTLDLAVADGDRPVTRVRLWGVDAPEIVHGSAAAAHFGAEAHRFVDEMLSGRVVHVVLAPQGTRGKYGRLLAYIHIERGGEMFNETLLSQGLAYADPRFDHPYRRTFLDMEQRARRSATGLWAGVDPGKMPSWRQRRMSRTD